MKKLITYALSFGMVAVLGCRDESLNPVPGWESGVHAYTAFADVAEPAKNSSSRKNSLAYAANFPKTGQDVDAAKVNFKIRWVSLDNVLTVSKAEVYVEMLDYYSDADGNPKTASLGPKLIKTISPAAANRQYSTFSISPTEIYNVYKDATFKYDKVNAVKVFANPANPRPTGKWFNGTEDFVITWKLYTADGKVFTTWNPDSVCGDTTPFSDAAANCQLVFDVK
ncbi:hypothetical protein [Spirosoma spitsbergense]|uniref:hypothetical protein n=1 Tax=Spirosoma spitsbergense TaxID=431554 RepID=UPI00035FBE22|nr:hypothetical protein [Spirosoma spitsbergense]